MSDFADDSNISLNAFDEQNADKSSLNGNNENDLNENDDNSKTEDEFDSKDDNDGHNNGRDRALVSANKTNDDEDRYDNP
ncbi:unnamed protein product [Medioppia subpectinata]|uniref:Uncharacterized protein n=1 Tax=Medioppia subpectinata TaxID=1979941 RepID=A0A7R9Q2W4_9ACAR|nr:unnamed protein product [Medioppia subpectinata]CAG2110687.1 unnamed protein product [Medioppia subpectinata]